MTRFHIPKISQRFDIDVTLPGSKSIALRQLAISALTDQESIIAGVPECDDTRAMLDALEALGVKITHRDGDITLTGPMNRTTDVTINARMSGASTRLLIGLAALRSGETRIDGHPSLQVRTNAPLLKVLQRYGCSISAPEHGGLPATITGPFLAESSVTESRLEIDGSLSSQYITALLIILPLMAQPTELRITGSLVSRPYIDITLNEMRRRGVDADWLSEDTLIVNPGAYKGGDYVIEGDATAATYFAGLATLHNSTVHLNNLGCETRQGDYAFMDIMAALGARIERTSAGTTIKGPPALEPLAELDMTTMPDAALTLIAMTPLLAGPTRITGLSSLHHKECDRLECPARELSAMGVQAETTDDTITVVPLNPEDFPAHELKTYHDHRMAMAFSLLGSRTGSITVDDERVVDKTYPAYWQDYGKALAG